MSRRNIIVVGEWLDKDTARAMRRGRIDTLKVLREQIWQEGLKVCRRARWPAEVGEAKSRLEIVIDALDFAIAELQ